MKRIMVLGGSGSGKSTFARALGLRLGIPAVHMDRLFWEPGWVEAENAVFMDRVQAEVAKDAWVMDGNYSRTWPDRLSRADTVIFLDMPTWLRFSRAVWRTVKGYGTTRFDLADNCPERFDFGFLFGWVLRYRWMGRHKAMMMMSDEGPAAHCQRHHLRSTKAVAKFLSKASPEGPVA